MPFPGAPPRPYHGAMPDLQPDLPRSSAFGEQLRHWRTQRRMSQLDLAQEAAVSTRHLSFVETGRAAPSREMVLRLVHRLDVPLRERNAMLVAAGFAPMYRERPFDDPALASARAAVEQILARHEPFPALAVDRHWHLLAANAMVPALIGDAAPELLAGRPNVLRLSLHPRGLAPNIVNLGEWRSHLLARLRHQIAASGDATLRELLEELQGYPAPGEPAPAADGSGIFVPLRLRSPAGELSFLSTTTVFGTPTDITLQELAIEAFFPADDATARLLRQMQPGR